MVQVQTVAVALIPEMQVRAVPAGILSRPAKFGQEDHNTMAMGLGTQPTEARCAA